MDQEEKRPLINRSLEELVGAILTLKAQAHSYDRYQEPGLLHLPILTVGYYSLEELRRRLSIDDYNWWLELFRSTGAVKPEAKICLMRQIS